MDLSDCIAFAMKNPLTYIATVEGDRPRVRAFAMWFADAGGFYYHTGSSKAVWKQLLKNPKVELCFYAPGEGGAGTMLRVSGSIEVVTDPAIRDRLFLDRPWVKSIMQGSPADTHLIIFRVHHGEARFWTMEYNLREQEAPAVKF